MIYDYRNNAWISDFQAKMRKKAFLYQLKWKIIKTVFWVIALGLSVAIWYYVGRAIGLTAEHLALAGILFGGGLVIFLAVEMIWDWIDRKEK